MRGERQHGQAWNTSWKPNVARQRVRPAQPVDHPAGRVDQPAEREQHDDDRDAVAARSRRRRTPPPSRARCRSGCRPSAAAPGTNSRNAIAERGAGPGHAEQDDPVAAGEQQQAERRVAAGDQQEDAGVVEPGEQRVRSAGTSRPGAWSPETENSDQRADREDRRPDPRDTGRGQQHEQDAGHQRPAVRWPRAASRASAAGPPPPPRRRGRRPRRPARSRSGDGVGRLTSSWYPFILEAKHTRASGPDPSSGAVVSRSVISAPSVEGGGVLVRPLQRRRARPPSRSVMPAYHPDGRPA